MTPRKLAHRPRDRSKTRVLLLGIAAAVKFFIVMLLIVCLCRAAAQGDKQMGLKN